MRSGSVPGTCGSGGRPAKRGELVDAMLADAAVGSVDGQVCSR